MKDKKIFKKYIKVPLLICLFGILFYANLRAKTESTFLIGIQLRDYPYLVSPQPLPPKEQKVLQQALVLGSKSTTNLWVNLQYNSPQRFVLSPELRGTDLSQILLQFDTQLKKVTQKIIQEELEIIRNTKLRILIQPTTVWIYQKKNEVIIKDIFLHVLVESDFLLPSEQEIIKERLENRVNYGPDFKELKKLIAGIILGKLYPEFIPPLPIHTEYHPYSPILLNYLQHIEKQPIGGILINFRKLKQIPLIYLPQKITSYFYRIRDRIIPKKTYNDPIEYLSAFSQEGLIYYLLSSSISVKSRLSLQIALWKIENAIKQNGPTVPQDINALSPSQRLIILTDIAIKHNLPIDKEIIATAVDEWKNHLSPEERKKILPRLTNTKVVVSPKSLVEPQEGQLQTKSTIAQRGITRRKFLKQLSLMAIFSTVIPTIPISSNAKDFSKTVQAKIDFFSLPLSEQKKLINKLLSNQLPKELKDTIEEQVFRTVKSMARRFMARRLLSSGVDASTRKEFLNKFNILLQTKAIHLPCFSDTKYLLSLIDFIMESSPPLRKKLYQYFFHVLNSPPQHGYTYKPICLYILTRPNFFSLELINKAGNLLKQRLASKEERLEARELCKLQYAITGQGEYLHDHYKEWEKIFSQHLASFPDIAIALAFNDSDETYTCVYNAIREELIRRINTKYHGNFFNFVDTNKLDLYRYYHVYYWNYQENTKDVFEKTKKTFYYNFIRTIVKREYSPDKFLCRLSKNPTKLVKFLFERSCEELYDSCFAFENRVHLATSETMSDLDKQLYDKIIINIIFIQKITQSKFLPKQWGIKKVKKLWNSLRQHKNSIGKKLFTLTLFDIDIWRELGLNPSKDIDPSVKEILRFLEFPIYPKSNYLNCAVVFYRDAIPFLKKFEKLLISHGYKRSAHHKYQYQKKIGDLLLTFHVFATKDDSTFKKVINDPSYQIIFTRHHSDEGEQFGGKGWPNILPQFIGTKNTGYGLQNNLFALVLAEEIAKGAQYKLSWNAIQEKVGKRMDISNFIFPNDILFKYAYILARLTNTHTDTSIPKLYPVLIVDGGCGGITRIPDYILRYSNSIKKFNLTQRYGTNLLTYIKRLRQKLKDKGKSGVPIVLTAHGMSHLMIANIQKELSREEHHQETKQEVKAGGIEIQTY